MNKPTPEKRARKLVRDLEDDGKQAFRSEKAFAELTDLFKNSDERDQLKHTAKEMAREAVAIRKAYDKIKLRIERLTKAGDELDEAILSRVEYAVTPKQKIDSANRIIVARHAWQEAKK